MPGSSPQNESQHLRAYAASFGDVVLAGPLSVPLNQRPWEWRTHNLVDLFGDLVTATDAWCEKKADGTWTPKPDADSQLPHFFGPVVLEHDSGGAGRAVVDGQQRLTATTVLVAIMRERAVRLQAGPQEARPSARALAMALTGWLLADPQSGATASRLQLDSTVQAFFDDYVVQAASDEERAAVLAVDPPSPDDESKDVRNAFMHAFRDLGDLLDEHLETLHPDGNSRAVLSRISAMFDTLKDRFETVVIDVLQPGMSPQLFSGLNARGTSLDEADKIKNELFVVSPPDDHGQVKLRWDEMVRAVPGRDAQAFLRLRHVAFVSDVKLRDLYGTVRRTELTGASGLPTVARWAEDSKFLRIGHALEAHTSVSEIARRHLLDIRLMRHTYAWPLLLASARAYLNSDATSFARAVLLTRNVSFRELAMGRRQAETFLSRIGPIARVVKTGTPVEELADALLKISPDDEFESRFTEHFEKNVARQYYILYNLEMTAGTYDGLVPAPHSGSGTGRANNIEHIYPRNPSRSRTGEFSAWRDASDPKGVRKDLELARRYLHRIGNLLLIEESINGDLSDYSFEAKQAGDYPASAKKTKAGKIRQSYADSQFTLAKDLADQTKWPAWEPSTVERRQAMLAKLALQAWSLQPVTT